MQFVDLVMSTVRQFVMKQTSKTRRKLAVFFAKTELNRSTFNLSAHARAQEGYGSSLTVTGVCNWSYGALCSSSLCFEYS